MWLGKRTIKTYPLTASIVSLPIRGPVLPSVVNQIPIHSYHGWLGRPTDKIVDTRSPSQSENRGIVGVAK